MTTNFMFHSLLFEADGDAPDNLLGNSKKDDVKISGPFGRVE